MTFKEIVARSGDSTLVDFVYRDGKLNVGIELDELDAYLDLKISTGMIKCVNFSELNDLEKHCRLEISPLDDELSVEKGFYVPDASFPGLMKSCKRGLNLAYGMKSSQMSHFFSIVGYDLLLACVIRDIDRDLEWKSRPLE